MNLVLVKNNFNLCFCACYVEMVRRLSVSYVEMVRRLCVCYVEIVCRLCVGSVCTPVFY